MSTIPLTEEDQASDPTYLESIDRFNIGARVTWLHE